MERTRDNMAEIILCAFAPNTSRARLLSAGPRQPLISTANTLRKSAVVQGAGTLVPVAPHAITLPYLPPPFVPVDRRGGARKPGAKTANTG
jgi:hypothetical protein